MTMPDIKSITELVVGGAALISAIAATIAAIKADGAKSSADDTKGEVGQIRADIKLMLNQTQVLNQALTHFQQQQTNLHFYVGDSLATRGASTAQPVSFPSLPEGQPVIEVEEVPKPQTVQNLKNPL
jgi:hypothetical protein